MYSLSWIVFLQTWATFTDQSREAHVEFQEDIEQHEVDYITRWKAEDHPSLHRHQTELH